MQSYNYLNWNLENNKKFTHCMDLNVFRTTLAAQWRSATEVIVNHLTPLTDHNQENPYEVNPAVEMFCILAEQAH